MKLKAVIPTKSVTSPPQTIKCQMRHLFFSVFLLFPLHITAQWNLQQLPEKPSIRAIDANGSHNIWISGSKGSILNSKDGGLSWDNFCPEEYRHLDFRGVAVLNDSTILAMSAGDASEGKAIVIKTSNNGISWREVLKKEEKGIFFDTIKFRSPWSGYIIGDPIDTFPYLLFTEDLGETWKRVENLPPVLDGEASFAASNSNITYYNKNVWFHTQGRIFHSFDQGKSWQAQNTLFQKGESRGIFGIFAIDSYTLVAVGGDYLDNEEPTLQYALSNSFGQSWYTNNDFWKGGLTECVASFGPKAHLISVGTIGSAISMDAGLSWKSLDSESFHVVKCFGNTCVAAGAEGRIGIITP